MPLYPIGTILSIWITEDVCLEEVKITDYSGDNKRGTCVECIDDSIDESVQATLNMPGVEKILNDTYSVPYPIDFSKC